MNLTTETLDKAYLEYSNITSAITRKEIELAMEVERLKIAYQNASNQRQHYVDKCLKLGEVVLEFASALDYNQQYLYHRHKELIQELKRNLQDNK
jgi:hypothetical protein